MTFLYRISVVLSTAMLACIAVPAFAEAPVFDADAMQQQFDNDSDSGQGGDASDNTFLPAQSSSSTASSSAGTSGLDQRVQHLEQQLNNLQSSESIARIESLQDQIQSLRGQVEELTHQLQVMQNQQKSIYTDLDKRLAQQNSKTDKKIAAGAVEGSTVPATDDASADNAKSKLNKIATTKQTAKTTLGADTTNTDARLKKTAVGGDQPNVAEEQQIYQTAYNLIKVKKYNEAVDALQGMLKKYPSGQFASNAHYWLGELYGLMGKNDLALNEFGTVVSSYPDSPRVSDAQLKVGLIYSAQSKWSDAKVSFKKVINHYPGTASARVASEQLKQIKTAGH